MLSSLVTLRKTRQVPPTRFVAANPGCWIQYYDDTAAKDPTKAMSVNSFNLTVAQRKQQEGCAVCFSLQAFGHSRTKEELLCFRNLGVDVDLILAAERRTLSVEEIDRRKDAYLTHCLLLFPLKPHWLIETGHGFHVLFRVLPPRPEDGVPEALALNRRLVRALRGDENAVLLTQVLRVPGTYQFKDPERSFLCRLLLDNASTIHPYAIDAVRSVLDAWEVYHKTGTGDGAERTTQGSSNGKQHHDGLCGVPEGQRNATATTIIGAILGRLPEHLWETAGWGGLKEWNRRNTVPLPERELRSVFGSIARRERGKRGRVGRNTDGGQHFSPLVRIENRIDSGKTTIDHKVENTNNEPADSSATSSPPNHAEH